MRKVGTPTTTAATITSQATQRNYHNAAFLKLPEPN